MIKYGVESDEMLEHCKRKVRMKQMTVEEAVKKLNKFNIEMTERDFKESIYENS